MRFIQAVAAAYLLLMVGFGAGAFVMQTRVWPFHAIREIYRFVQGYRDEQTSIFQKIWSDAGIRPERFLHKYQVKNPDTYRPVEGLNLSNRRIAPLLHLAPGNPDGYIYIVGKFDFDGAMNGVILMTTSGTIVRTWKIPDSLIKDGHHHMFQFLRDGSFVAAPDYASIYHIDRCGKQIGSIPGEFHHAITPIGNGRFYVAGSSTNPDAFSIVNINTKTIERSVPLTEVHDKADPDLNVFGLYVTQRHEGEEDTWHINDIEPFPSTAKSDRFKPGDLLISYRHSNLVYVIDPNTLELKWWTQAYTSGQHDPDWQPDGSITVYNNRLYRKGNYSTVVRYDFESDRPAVVFDGRKYDFFADVGGKHQFLEDKSLLQSSYGEGRVLWIDGDGKIRFDFVNRYSDTEALVILNTGYLPPDFFGANGLGTCN